MTPSGFAVITANDPYKMAIDTSMSLMSASGAMLAFAAQYVDFNLEEAKTTKMTMIQTRTISLTVLSYADRILTLPGRYSQKSYLVHEARE